MDGQGSGRKGKGWGKGVRVQGKVRILGDRGGRKRDEVLGQWFSGNASRGNLMRSPSGI